MNGDVNTWERQSTGGAKGFYDDEGNYLGFTSQDGSWWPNIPGTPKPGTSTGVGGPAPEDKHSDYCARNPWALDCLIFGTPSKPGPGAIGGQVAKGAGDAYNAATGWITGQITGIAIIAIGALFLFMGLQGLVKSNG